MNGSIRLDYAHQWMLLNSSASTAEIYSRYRAPQTGIQEVMFRVSNAIKALDEHVMFAEYTEETLLYDETGRPFLALPAGFHANLVHSETHAGVLVNAIRECQKLDKVGSDHAHSAELVRALTEQFRWQAIGQDIRRRNHVKSAATLERDKLKKKAKRSERRQEAAREAEKAARAGSSDQQQLPFRSGKGKEAVYASGEKQQGGEVEDEEDIEMGGS